MTATNNVLSVTGDGSSVVVGAYKGASDFPQPKTGEVWFFYAKAKVTNSDCEELNLRLREGTLITLDNQSFPTIDENYELYAKRTIASEFASYYYRIDSQYADAATANGKVMEVQEVMAINMTALGIESKTEAEMLAMARGAYIEGLQGTEPCEISSVGKNLIKNGNGEFGLIGWKEVSTGSISWDGEKFNVSGVRSSSASPLRYVYKDIKLESNKVYKVNATLTGTDNILIGLLTDTGEYIGSVNLATGGELTTLEGSNYRIAVMGNSSGSSSTSSFKEFIVSNETIIYEPFTKTTVKTHSTLHSLPNGVYDSEDINKGILTKRCAEYELVSGDITGLSTGANIDYITIALSVFIGVKPQSDSIIDGSFVIDGFPIETNSLDEVGNEYHFKTYSTQLRLIIPSGTYATLGDAQTALAGTKVIYELAEPVITNYPKQTLIAKQSGTIYNEFHKTEQANYNFGIRVKDSNFPIASLVEIKKINLLTKEETAIDIADCTIVAGGLSYTCTALAEGDTVNTKYAYEFLSTRGDIAYTHPTSNNGQANSNTKMIGQLDAKVEQSLENIKSSPLVVNYFVAETGLASGFTGVAMFQAPGNLDVIITKITMMRQGAFAGVDGANPFTVNITNNAIDTVATQAFTSTPGATEDIAVDLEFQKIVAGDKLNLAHTYGGTANPPAVTYQIEYILA